MIGGLSSPGSPASVGNAKVLLQQNSGASWSTIAETVTDQDGSYEFVFAPRNSGQLRVSLAATDGLAPCVADAGRVSVTPSLSTPKVSGKVRAKRTLTFSGTVAPGHRALIKVAFYRVVKKKLKAYKTYKVYSNSSGTWTLKAHEGRLARSCGSRRRRARAGLVGLPEGEGHRLAVLRQGHS